MPRRKMRKGSYKDLVHPLNDETRKLIEERVLTERRKFLALEDSSSLCCGELQSARSHDVAP